MTVDLETTLMSHLEHLCQKIGPRPNASPGNHAAARYIHNIFRDKHWEVEEQRFACPAWTPKQTSLILNGESLPAAANAFSPPCNVHAPTVVAATIAELEAAELTGRIGILCGDLAAAPLSPKSWLHKSERDDQIIHLLEQKQPAALITVQADIDGFERVIEDWEFLIPSATVPPDVGLILLQHCSQAVTLRIDTEQSPGFSMNIVARSAGNAQGKVVVCAHYDTKIDTPGAFDNGSGVAVLLILAQILNPKDYPYGLELVAFSGEEYLPLGDDEYVKRAGSCFDEIIAAINVDAVGQYLAASSIASFSTSKAFQAAVQHLTSEYLDMVWVEPWPQSNHSTFVSHGVPSVALSSTGGVHLEHRSIDIIGWLNPHRLNSVIRLIAEILELLREKSPAWTRETEGN